jgi:hypothetical protein
MFAMFEILYDDDNYEGVPIAQPTSNPNESLFTSNMHIRMCTLHFYCYY